MQGHALAISGKVGGGKSLIIMNVIKPYWVSSLTRISMLGAER